MNHTPERAQEFAQALVEGIRSAIERHMFVLGTGLQTRLTASIGFACYPLYEDEPGAVAAATVSGRATACVTAAVLLGLTRRRTKPAATSDGMACNRRLRLRALARS